jgi:mono/diheme cytochrome c family protein
MKHLSLLFLILLFKNSLLAQSCCNVGANGMAAFASNEEFQLSHQLPLAYIHTSEVGGKMISFGTANNAQANGYLIKSKNEKSKKYLFVYQEWWGLNEHIKKQAEKFYDDLDGQVNVLAMDMYDGQIATKPEEAGKYLANPLDANERNLDLGKRKFLTFCSPCHGNYANGESRLNGQFPNGPTMHSDKVVNWSDGQLYHVISEGQNVMPGYSKQATRDERWAIVLYVRTLQRAMNAKESDLK